MLRRFDRYVFAAILEPLALGLLICTFTLLLRGLARSVQNVSGTTCGQEPRFDTGRRFFYSAGNTPRLARAARVGATTGETRP